MAWQHEYARFLKRTLGRIRQTIPSGVGKAHSVASQPAQEFVKWRGWPSIKDKERILAQFGTLGSGNHFAEVSEDSDGFVWVLVHSGSRGIGNKIAQHHIAIARALGTRVEHRDLSYRGFSAGYHGTLEISASPPSTVSNPTAHEYRSFLFRLDNR